MNGHDPGIDQRPNESPFQGCRSSNSIIGARECHLAKNRFRADRKDKSTPCHFSKCSWALKWSDGTGTGSEMHQAKEQRELFPLYLLVIWDGLIESGGLDHATWIINSSEDLIKSYFTLLYPDYLVPSDALKFGNRQNGALALL